MVKSYCSDYAFPYTILNTDSQTIIPILTTTVNRRAYVYRAFEKDHIVNHISIESYPGYAGLLIALVHDYDPFSRITSIA